MFEAISAGSLHYGRTINGIRFQEGIQGALQAVVQTKKERKSTRLHCRTRQGDPNIEAASTRAPCTLLCSVAYTVKMPKRRGPHEIEGYFDFVCRRSRSSTGGRTLQTAVRSTMRGRAASLHLSCIRHRDSSLATISTGPSREAAAKKTDFSAVEMLKVDLRPMRSGHAPPGLDEPATIDAMRMCGEQAMPDFSKPVCITRSTSPSRASARQASRP